MFGFGDKLELNAAETALVLIDLEHAIVERSLAPLDGKDVVTECARLAQAMRSAGGTVVYVHVLMHEMLRMPADKPMIPPGTPPPPEAVSELVPGAGYQPGRDILVAKNQWDAFYGTGLKEKLDAKGVKTIVLAGIATNFGVESTARSAIAQGYPVVFAQDAMSSMKKEMHEFAIENTFPVIGKVSTVDKIIDALGK